MKNQVNVNRQIDKKNHAAHAHASVDAFLNLPVVNSGIHSIWSGGLPIDGLISSRKSDILVVVLNGATTLGVRLPWLSGTGITSNMNVSKLFLSDPSLYLGDGLNSAYYSGSYLQPQLQDDLVCIVSKVAESTLASHIVFLGGSSGGFAALRLSNSFPASTAVVFNPQTNLWRHLPRPVMKWLSVAWGIKSLNELPPSVKYNLNRLYSDNFHNRVVYLQNRTDHHHDRHFIPFMEEAGAGNVQYLVHDEANGHQPPPKEFIRHVLEQSCATLPSEPLEGFFSR